MAPDRRPARHSTPALTALAARLRKARLDAGMRGRDVRALTGIDLGNLSRIEQGRRQPTMAVLQRLAQAYQVPVADLLAPPGPASFVVIATWIARSGEERVVREVIAAMTPPSRAEPGCLGYAALVSTRDPRTFVLLERYVDAAAYEAHRATRHFQELVVGRALPRLESRRVETFEALGD